MLDDTPAVLSLGKLCEEHGHSHEWASGQKPHLTKEWERDSVHDGKRRSRSCPRTVVELQGKFVFYIVFAGLIDSLSAASLRNDGAHQQALGNGRDNPKTKK